MALENDFVILDGKRRPKPHGYDIFGKPVNRFGEALHSDRFLIGGREDQPDGFVKPEGTENLET